MSHYMTALAMRQTGLKPAAKLVLYWLADHHNESTGECHPSLNTLAAECEMDRSTVVRHLDALEEAGLIKRIARTRDNGSQTSTAYVLSLTPVAKYNSPCGKIQQGPVAKCDPQNLGNKNLGNEPSLFASEDAQKRDDSQQKPNIEEQFERFWRIYPRKIGKGGARAKFAAAMKRGTFDAIMAGVQRYAAHIRQAGTEEKFIAHAATWLHQERWTDALPDAPAAFSLSQIEMLLQQAMIEDRLNNPAEARRLRAEARKLGWQG